MAVAHGREVQVAKEGDVAVGRIVDRYIDTENGIVAEVEQFAVQVPTEDGGTATVVGERIRAAKIVSLYNNYK